MTREEAKAMLGETATEEQITALLNKFHSEQDDLRKQVETLESKVSTTEKANTELLGYKKKVEEIEKANMSEQEKLKLEKEELEKAKVETKKLTNSIKAKEILLDVGIEKETVDDLVASIVKDDEVSTIKSAELLASQFKTVKEKTEKQTKEELMNMDLTPNASNKQLKTDIKNWEDFEKLSLKEQNEFIKENPEIFEKL
ncbi:MAG: hypothetical protein HFJ48_01305 [Clostridia bacterium]|nr:hypothetical protein [Clostridia bacterium]